MTTIPSEKESSPPVPAPFRDMFDPSCNPFIDMFKQLSAETQDEYRKIGEYMYGQAYETIGIGPASDD